MADNPYRVTEAELRRSTGHAPGQELVETEPEVEVPHDLPIRVTPMSPVTEIQALGQFTASRGGRRRAARMVAVGFVAITLGSLTWTAYAVHRGSSTTPDKAVRRLCALADRPHATAAEWDAISAAGFPLLKSIGAFRNTAGNRAVFDAGARLTSLASGRALDLRTPSSFPALGPDFDAEQARTDLVRACVG